ncbi:MAG: PhoH-like ATPase [Alphaproteobacteria bacterium]|jgi:PhoH-like ATPase
MQKNTETNINANINKSTTSEQNSTPRVLDTSALVHDPRSLLAYQDDVYICLTVLEELDNLKERRDKSVSADARLCIRMLEDLVNGHDADQMQLGIELPKSETGKRGKLFIGVDTNLAVEDSLKHGIGSDADNRIINYAFQLQKRLGQNVAIVTRDINMRAEDVLIDTQIADIDLLYSGVQAFKGDLFDQLESDKGFKLSGSLYQFERSLFNDKAQFNMYWYDDESHHGLITEVTDKHVFTKLLPRKQEKIWGISPKKTRQAIALSQLTDPHYDLNILLGPAGSDKTGITSTIISIFVQTSIKIKLAEDKIMKKLKSIAHSFLNEGGCYA